MVRCSDLFCIRKGEREREREKPVVCGCVFVCGAHYVSSGEIMITFYIFLSTLSCINTYI